ncbi:Hydrogen peroxide-inducible gene activator [Qipengyuania citrea LAMA 915]|jgi:LysR family transcriptional regulator, hydrogen peroxide-inducible genes activator|uniref:Hydrogen peroxide-inducible gene activator n=1 Tax=Qipengyuania citrea LAMA 915 TaxID=1306953 RepID=A0A0L1KHC1_9SPHN|nr:hydrogen peroxide-inducible genes activator [Qipengyuania citrea]KNH03388.1 Hydrogen peroxide-inducible gene activator [Qipengyuania citrea LAMA 915]
MATLKQIAIFAKLADTGNMSEAANALALTQPALSQQLRTLETSLGLKLFERVPKGMQLTPAGRDLLSAARNVQNAVRDFDDAADRAAERFVGSIRFGVTPTLGPYLMPSVIKTLHRRYPGLRLYIREGIPDQQHAELAAGELDMVLSPLPIAGRGLAIEPLFREPLRIVVPPDDPLNERPRLVAADFAGRTFLTLDHRHHYHRQLETICGHLDATVLADYEGTSLDAVQQMVGSGVGLAILPELYIRSDAGGLDVVRIAEPEGWQEYRSVGVAWRSSAAFAELYTEIGETIAEEARIRLSGAGPRG